MKHLGWVMGLGAGFWAQYVFAAQICVSPDMTTWTQDQKNLRIPVAYELLCDANAVDCDAGKNVPSLSGDSVCVTNPTVDVATVVTAQKILDRYTSDEALRQTATLAEQNRQATFNAEVSTNDLCTAELSDIITRIDTTVATLQGQLDATSTNAQFKTHIRNDLYPILGAALKKVAKCVRARAR